MRKFLIGDDVTVIGGEWNGSDELSVTVSRLSPVLNPKDNQPHDVEEAVCITIHSEYEGSAEVVVPLSELKRALEIE